MTTRNKLDPTSSSILLAKRLAFLSVLNSPGHLNNPKPTEPCTAATRTQQEPRALQSSPIMGNRENRQVRNGPKTVAYSLPMKTCNGSRHASAPQMKLAAREVPFCR